MFDNIGGKIKGLAAAVTWIGIAGSVIFWISTFSSGSNEAISVGLIVMIIGSLVSWLSSLTLYGFGELIEKMSSVEKLMKKVAGEEDSKVKDSKKPEEHTVIEEKKPDEEIKEVKKSEELEAVKEIEKIIPVPKMPVAKNSCEICGKSDFSVTSSRFVDETGTHIRTVCNDCFKKYSGTKK